MNTDRGMLFIFSGPSGSGKGTICEALLKNRKDIMVSISSTTRVPRSTDVEGETYYFKTEEQFKKMIENDELLEWVQYCENYYGTPKKELEDKLNDGINVILEIDVIGGLNIKSKYPESVLIFILPPTFQELVNRLKKRGTENESVINQRIKKAIDELELGKKYDYFIQNDTVENAVKHIEQIIEAEKSRMPRNHEKFSEFIGTIKEVFLS